MPEMFKGQAGSKGSPCPSLTPSGRVSTSGVGGDESLPPWPAHSPVQNYPPDLHPSSLVLADKG